MEFQGLTPSGDERRGQERKILRANAQLRLPGVRPIEVRTLDISVGGMAVVASVNPQAGAACTICIAPVSQPRGAVSVDIRAVIVHSIFSNREDGFKIGLQFADLSPEAIETVSRYLGG